MFLLFVVGNLIGTALLAVGLLVSRAVPVWAALGILAWPPLHVIGLVFFGNEVPQVIGAVLQAIGFAGCAAVLLRRRLDVILTGAGPRRMRFPPPDGRRDVRPSDVALSATWRKTTESGRAPGSTLGRSPGLR